jgi:putative phage-type endonuclease
MIAIDRTTGLGSTDVLEVAGLAPWKGAGPWRVYMAKTDPQPEPEVLDDQLAWGHEMETVLRGWYNRTYGRRVLECPRVESAAHPWLWASPDGREVYKIAGVSHCYYEFKNVGSFMAAHWDRADDDGIPDYVRAQVTIGMYCAEVTEWTVVAAIGGLPPRVYTVQYDRELAEMLAETGRRFWVENVLARVPPPVDASEACRKYLVKKYPRDEREMRESDFEDEALATARVRCATAAKEAAKEVKEIDARLLANIGDAKGIAGLGWKMTWKCDKNGTRRSRFTWKGGEDE